MTYSLQNKVNKKKQSLKIALRIRVVVVVVVVVVAFFSLLRRGDVC